MELVICLTSMAGHLAISGPSATESSSGGERGSLAEFVRALAMFLGLGAGATGYRNYQQSQ